MSVDSVYSTAYGTGAAVSTASTKSTNINAVYEDENETPTVEMFLQLMIAQMQNQDPMNPVDNTQYVTQMSQIASMQQMQELAYYSRSNFVMSLVGKEVTVAQAQIGGNYNNITGAVEKISLVDGEYVVTVNGQQFELKQISQISDKKTVEDSTITGLSMEAVDVSPNSVVIAWQTPSIQQDADAANYRYTLYYSTSDSMDTLHDVTQAQKADVVNEKGVNQGTITGLSQDTLYYANVVRTSPDGTQKVYKKLSFITPTAV